MDHRCGSSWYSVYPLWGIPCTADIVFREVDVVFDDRCKACNAAISSMFTRGPPVVRCTSHSEANTDEITALQVSLWCASAHLNVVLGLEEIRQQSASVDGICGVSYCFSMVYRQRLYFGS